MNWVELNAGKDLNRGRVSYQSDESGISLARRSRAEYTIAALGANVKTRQRS